MGTVMTIGTLTSVMSFIGVIFCTIHHEWEKTSPVNSATVMRTIYSSQGLWMRCNIPIAGVLNCDSYGTTFFDVQGYLQAIRAFSVISVLLLFCSTVCNTLALDCVMTDASKRRKLWLARIGGTTSVLGGICIITAVSWYAAGVIREFHRHDNRRTDFKFTFGAALYVGWISGALALIGGGLVTCSRCYFTTDDDSTAPYVYRQPKSKASATNYV